jgi:hypothetical protein
MAIALGGFSLLQFFILAFVSLADRLMTDIEMAGGKKRKASCLKTLFDTQKISNIFSLSFTNCALVQPRIVLDMFYGLPTLEKAREHIHERGRG